MNLGVAASFCAEQKPPLSATGATVGFDVGGINGYLLQRF